MCSCSSKMHKHISNEMHPISNETEVTTLIRRSSTWAIPRKVCSGLISKEELGFICDDRFGDIRIIDKHSSSTFRDSFSLLASSFPYLTGIYCNFVVNIGYRYICNRILLQFYNRFRIKCLFNPKFIVFLQKTSDRKWKTPTSNARLISKNSSIAWTTAR